MCACVCVRVCGRQRQSICKWGERNLFVCLQFQPWFVLCACKQCSMLVPASFVTTEESNASIELSLMCFHFIFCCFGSYVMLIINQITYICVQVCQGIIVSSPSGKALWGFRWIANSFFVDGVFFTQILPTFRKQILNSLKAPANVCGFRERERHRQWQREREMERKNGTETKRVKKRDWEWDKEIEWAGIDVQAKVQS